MRKRMKKKDLNPFTKWGSWIGVVIALLVAHFYLNLFEATKVISDQIATAPYFIIFLSVLALSMIGFWFGFFVDISIYAIRRNLR